MKTKKITQEVVNRAWKAWEKAQEKYQKAWELERKFKEQEGLE